MRLTLLLLLVVVAAAAALDLYAERDRDPTFYAKTIPRTPPPNATQNCGNGVLDAGEVCDDGNKRDFDGCSADCKWRDAPTYPCKVSITDSVGNPVVGIESIPNASLLVARGGIYTLQTALYDLMAILVTEKDFRSTAAFLENSTHLWLFANDTGKIWVVNLGGSSPVLLWMQVPNGTTESCAQFYRSGGALRFFTYAGSAALDVNVYNRTVEKRTAITLTYSKPSTCFADAAGMPTMLTGSQKLTRAAAEEWTVSLRSSPNQNPSTTRNLTDVLRDMWDNIVSTMVSNEIVPGAIVKSSSDDAHMHTTGFQQKQILSLPIGYDALSKNPYANVRNNRTLFDILAERAPPNLVFQPPGGAFNIDKHNEQARNLTNAFEDMWREVQQYMPQQVWSTADLSSQWMLRNGDVYLLSNTGAATEKCRPVALRVCNRCTWGVHSLVGACKPCTTIFTPNKMGEMIAYAEQCPLDCISMPGKRRSLLQQTPSSLPTAKFTILLLPRVAPQQAWADLNQTKWPYTCSLIPAGRMSCSVRTTDPAAASAWLQNQGGRWEVVTWPVVVYDKGIVDTDWEIEVAVEPKKEDMPETVMWVLIGAAILLSLALAFTCLLQRQQQQYRLLNMSRKG